MKTVNEKLALKLLTYIALSVFVISVLLQENRIKADIM